MGGTVSRKEWFMPRKRSLEVRLDEAERKMEDLKLEKAIKEMKDKRAARRARPARRRR